ncbi:MAG: NAD-dependent epimerase/dehydratase family protein [Candidatus Thermoplasmatota archaeon]|nr:NAD-dependent epimerase/dehydratase family protein [Candidatus Thermoplasmatota archaeon]
MRAFVTGGAGFIGSHLVDRLISKGHGVTVFDNLSSGKKDFIKHHMINKNFNFVKADLIDYETVLKELKGHDTVFHIAANPDVRLGAQKPEIAKKDIIATYNLLDSMGKLNLKEIVFSSSSTIYGETPPIPLPENYGPLLPISVYGAAKLAAEGLVSSFCHSFGMKGWIFRFANVVGERGTHGVIVDFIKKLRKNPKELEILGDGKQKKPYLYITDTIDGIFYGYENTNEQTNLLNLGCTTSTEVTRIAEIVVEEMGLKDVKFKYTGGKRGWIGDVPQFQFDIKKMSKLGWNTSYSSDEAVRKAVLDLLDTNL